ncbi:hypothetical protein OHC33_002376 [Knufia fluminis]|uniref:Uncharacterized protein n=1 Tax=Knufia fluminis TaxID=191047 RepID=A0AAN8IR89_9EURO|nr:hypothetical protein OHC33_002376 [Knufia fluminis]
MSNTRSLRNRSSRYSSPATFTSVNPGSAPPVQETIEVRQPENGVQVQGQAQGQSQQGSWVEPLPRHGVASFEDTKGLERVGVLEHMQPLGVAPNQKLLQRLKVNNYRPSLSARATPVYSEGVASPSVEPTKEEVASPIIDPELLLDASTPPVPPPQEPPQLQSPQSHPQPEPEPQPLSYPQPVTQYHPQLYPPPLAQPFQHLPEQPPPPPVIMSPPRGRPAKKEVEEMRVYPGPDDSFLSPLANGTPRSSRASPKYPPSVQDHSKDARIKAYLQNAIDKAHRENKHDVAAGLVRVMDESYKDEVFTALDNISKFKASVRIEQFKVFKKYIKKGIRKHRRDSMQQPEFHDDRLPPPSQSQPVAYYSSFQMNTKRPTVDTTMNDDNDIQPLPDVHASVSDRANNASPTDLAIHSPSVADTTMADLPSDLPSNLPPKPSPRKRRSSSGSSLSSAQSLPSDYIATDESANQDQPSEGRPTRAAAQRQAPSRAAAGRATRYPGTDQSGAVGAHPLGYQNLELTSLSADNVRTKKQKLTPIIPPEEEAAIEQEKRNLTNQLDQFKKTWKPAQLGDDIRSDVDDHKRVNPPKTLEPYTGPPPPVIHPHALNPSSGELSSPASHIADTVAVNGASRKRTYDQSFSDDDSELSSADSSPPPPPPAFPRLGSRASSTRASTPRAAKTSQVMNSRKKQRVMDS